MSRHPLRVARTVLAACALQGAASACMAQTQITPTVRASWQSQDPGGVLTGGLESPPVLSFENGQWVFQGGGALLLNWNPSQPNAGLGTLDLHFDFQPWHMPLDAHWELVISPHPDQMSVRAVSRFIAPPDAQLATARGSNRWDVTASGTEHYSAEVSPVALGSLDSSVGLTPPVWATAPQAAGHWDLSVTQTLIGSYHLVASSDPDCLSLACMPGQRAAASLQSLEFYLPQSVELRAIVSSVPEPQVPVLLAAGLGLLALRRGRSGARS
ncbi:hypothetical protein [Roseateles sp. P5_E11]